MGIETAILGAAIGLGGTVGTKLLTKKPKPPGIKPPPEPDTTAPARAVEAQKQIQRRRQGLASSIVAGEQAQKATTQTAADILRGTLG